MVEGAIKELGQLTNSKSLFENFIKNLLASIQVEGAKEYRLPADSAPKRCASILNIINQFVYCQSEAIKGKKCALGDLYLSEFHKFWEENHQQILGLAINAEKCKQVADILEKSYRVFSPLSIIAIEGYPLDPMTLADVRLFTTIQDFGFGFKCDYYDLAVQKPFLFNAQAITENPNYVDELLAYLGVADYQVDKRREWAKRCAQMLFEKYDNSAYNIAKVHNFNAPEIRNVLVKANMGLSNKKADMFLRDMQELNVWHLHEFEEIDVASDQNTMRIALRTGIVQTSIPLLSSFIDVFCYQYTLIDQLTRQAWRKVWQAWHQIPDNQAVESPAQIDFLIYEMGRNCCRPKIRRCERQCDANRRNKCILKKLVFTNCEGWCLFRDICEHETKRLNPPKSISQRGRTSWSVSYSDEGGGLGLRAS